MSKSKKGNINVSVDNIFPLIKKFLYSDHEIFLRELISNATDATTKLKHLVSIGKTKIDCKDCKIEVKIDSKNKTLHITDEGIGMNKEEVEKYINELAFSGAQDFLNTYDKEGKESGIIGHFGLGFYSAFMVSEKVEIFTKNYKGDSAVHWQCDGSPEYTIGECSKETHGTEIVLHIDKDSKEFLEEYRIRELLLKYNKFMPIPIKFGTKKEAKKKNKDDENSTSKTKENEKEEFIEVDDIINNSNPAWTRPPNKLKEEDYDSFFRELYPMNFDKPLFNIHLNVDYPFHLTGILFFPKLDVNLNFQKDKIQLYQNQVFVTDNVEGIVPEFLTLLRGVIDSPDIPLNVSRSYLQADSSVKKISNYISKKVADKLSSLFKKDRSSYEDKWNDIKMVIEYGMISDEKFYDKSKKFFLYPTVEGKYYTFDELKEKIKPSQTDKDDKLVILYTSDKDAQHSYIQEAKEKGYQVVLLDSPIIPHLIQKIESKEEKLVFSRIDADHIDNLIKKDEEAISKLSDEEKESLKKDLENIISKEEFSIQLEPMDSKLPPFKITQPEFMRRMKDMQASGGGGMFGMSHMPEAYNLIINTNHNLISKILETKKPEDKERLIKQSLDLAKLSQGLLKGENLTNFLNRSFELIK